MMIANLSTPKMTPQEYLDWEEQQPLRYEYFDGEVITRTGSTIPHNQVAVNLASLLKNHLRGRGCKILTSDAKVKLSDDGSYCYADVSVTCDEHDRSARQFIRFPSLIVEVLSPSTEAFDRGKKFRKYRRIKTLKEYVLVDPDRMSLECYRLNERGNWELFHYFVEDTEDCEVFLSSVDLQFSLTTLYEDVEFDEVEELME
jgi:Uma2 family endonuclease